MANIKDLTGQRFGRLTAIKPTDARKEGSVVWECSCDCGNTTLASKRVLIRGEKKSCGCLQKELQINIAGQKFGKLTAIRPLEERINGLIMWECQCDCGEITYATSGNLRAGNKKSCGCLQGDQYIRNIAGQKFGRLTAIRPIKDAVRNRRVWEWQCECGQTTFKPLTDVKQLVRRGYNPHCGCLQKNRITDITGQKFGKLTAIRPLEERRNRQVVWECQCECGKITHVTGGNLRTGCTKSCGCMAKNKKRRTKV